MIYLIWLDLRGEHHWTRGAWWTVRRVRFADHARLHAHMWLERRMGMTQDEWLDKEWRDRDYYTWPLNFCKTKPFDVQTFVRLLLGYYSVPRKRGYDTR